MRFTGMNVMCICMQSVLYIFVKALQLERDLNRIKLGFPKSRSIMNKMNVTGS